MSISRLMDRPIAFQRTYVRLGVGVTGALMLSQAVYWSARASNGGWFYKDRDEWEEETGLTRREQETARKRLKEAGFLLEDRRGLPCRLYFKVDHGALDKALLALVETVPSSRAESAQQAGADAPNSEGEKRHSSTETTTETTSEITPSSPGGDLVREVFEYWVEVMGKTRATVLGSKRKTKIEKALKAYGLDNVKKAIDGCRLTPFNMGDNDKGQAYNDIELILRNEVKIESFIEAADNPPKAAARPAMPLRGLGDLDHKGDAMLDEDGRIAPEPRRHR